MGSYDTLSEATSDLNKRGYTIDFNMRATVFIVRRLADLLNPTISISWNFIGFDNKLKKYVWLTTGILKDERLEIVNYQQEAESDELY